MSPNRQARLALLQTLREPARAQALCVAGWSDLVAAARDANLLGALAKRLEAAGVPTAVDSFRIAREVFSQLDEG